MGNSKNKKSRAKHLPQKADNAPRPDFSGLMLGNFKVPEFDKPAAVFGARLDEYPKRDTIPKVDRKFSDVFSALFFRGGSLADHGLMLKSEINRPAAMMAIRAWMTSFDPKHEHKEETVAWALSEWCDQI